MLDVCLLMIVRGLEPAATGLLHNSVSQRSAYFMQKLLLFLPLSSNRLGKKGVYVHDNVAMFEQTVERESRIYCI